MKVNIVQHAKDEISKLHKTVVIIDTFRATSTIVTAFAKGAKEIRACKTLEEAISVAASYHKNECVLVGEVNMVCPESFDCGNSPIEISKKNIKNKIIILSTTNGTSTIRRSENAEKIYICSLLNSQAVAEQLYKDNKDFTIFCAGSIGQYAIEDVITAGMLLHCINLLGKNVELDDFSKTAVYLYIQNKERDNNLVKDGRSFHRLVEKVL